MELRHLRYFIAVAEELHFGNAAKRLNISQPPLSQQIKKLENHLNISLFHRTNRNVELTEAGKSLYQSAVKIMNDIKLAYEEAESTAKGCIGELQLGFSGTAAFNILPDIIKACSNYCPGISLQLSQLTTAEQIKALENRSIDLGILVPPIQSSLISAEIIRTEEFMICLPENHRLANQEKINIKDLKNESFIMSPKQSGIGYYESVQKIFEEAGFEPHKSQTANEQLTMVSLVASDLGIVIVPKSMEAVKIRGTVYKELDKSYKKISSIAWNIENKRPVTKKFLALIREHIIPLYLKT